MSRSFLYILSFFLFGCAKDTTVIDGFTRLKSQKIYLIDLNKKDVIKDSATIVNGHFRFKYDAGQIKEPFEAALCVRSLFNGHEYLRPLGFVNPYDDRAIQSTLYVDRGTTTIHYFTNNGRDLYKINGSKQNEPLYRHLQLEQPNQDNVTDRKKIIENNLFLISRYPNSYYLLSELYINRANFTPNEVEELLDGFSASVVSSRPYKKLKIWTASKKEGVFPLTNLTLKDNMGMAKQMIDTSARANLIIFWASWCGPCRREIPHLKEIYQRFHTSGLSITSISLDNSSINWQQALAVEKMPWNQLISNDSSKSTFELEYDMSSIPLAIVIDRKRNILKRLAGLGAEKNLSDFLANLLAVGKSE